MNKQKTTVRVSVTTTRCLSVAAGGGVVEPPVNKFEQASSDDHQISLAGGMSLSEQV